MAYPILPLIPNWETNFQEATNLNKTQYGQGVIQRERKAPINRTSQMVSLSITVNNKLVVDAFLRSQKGKPFRLSFDNGITNDGNLYFCQEWNWSDLGMDWSTIDLQLMQTFRHEQP